METTRFSEFLPIRDSYASKYSDRRDGRQNYFGIGADGRRSYADVGAEVGLSTAAVHERVKKMLDKGVIRRFSISVDPACGPELHRLRGHPQ
jgi:hypothetical protein